MDAGLIARRYATVLYDYAKQHGVTDLVYADAQNVRKAIAQTDGAQHFFESPLYMPSRKKELLKATFEGRVTDEMLQFLNFLVDKERISLVVSILLVFELIYKKEKSVCTASVTTATELSASQQQQLTDRIAGKMRDAGHTVSGVDASFVVDPGIIGGIILRIDGRQVDDSVLSRLKQIEKQLVL